VNICNCSLSEQTNPKFWQKQMFVDTDIKSRRAKEEQKYENKITYRRK